MKRPYRGSKIVPVRVDEDTVREMARAIRERNNRSANVPWNASDFIRQAIRDKLDHIKRSRKPRAPKKGGEATEKPATA